MEKVKVLYIETSEEPFMLREVTKEDVEHIKWVKDVVKRMQKKDVNAVKEFLHNYYQTELEENDYLKFPEHCTFRIASRRWWGTPYCDYYIEIDEPNVESIKEEIENMIEDKIGGIKVVDGYYLEITTVSVSATVNRAWGYEVVAIIEMNKEDYEKLKKLGFVEN